MIDEYGPSETEISLWQFEDGYINILTDFGKLVGFYSFKVNFLYIPQAMNNRIYWRIFC